jgi:hypothetical protein
VPVTLARRRLDCAAYEVALSETAAGAPMSESVDAHVRQCLRCQAELVSYRRLLRGLRSLADQPAVLPERFEPQLVSSLHLGPPPPANRVAPVALATVGGLAAVASVAALVVRYRRIVRLAG